MFKLKSDIMQNILRVLLVSILTLSVYSKLITYVDFVGFMQIILHSSEQLALLCSNTMLVIEIFLLILLIVNKSINHVLNIILYLFILFSLFNLYLIIANYTSNCFCFGSFLEMSPTSSLIKNVVIITLILINTRPFKFSDFTNFELIAFVMAIILIQFIITKPINYFEKPFNTIAVNNIMKNDNFLLIDSRHPDSYNREHIPGAINIPYYLERNDKDKLKIIILEKLKNVNKTLVVYCDSKICSQANSLSRIIKRYLPSKEIYILDGGIEKWIGKFP